MSVANGRHARHAHAHGRGRVQAIRATLKTNSGNVHVKMTPHWDLGTAVRFTESLGFKGLYTIEVDFDPAIRMVYNTVLVNLS